MRGAQDEVTGGVVRGPQPNGPLRWPVVAVAFVAVSAALSTLLALTNIYRDGTPAGAVPAGPGLARRVVPGRRRLVLVHRRPPATPTCRGRSRRSRSSRCTPWACAGWAAAGRRPAGGVAARGARRARARCCCSPGGCGTRLPRRSAIAGDRRPAASTRTRSSSTAPCTPTRCSCSARSARSSCSSAGGTSPRAWSVRWPRPGGRSGSPSPSGSSSARSRCSRSPAARRRPDGRSEAPHRRPRRARARRGRRLARPGLRRPRRAPASSRRARRGARDRRVVRLPRAGVRDPLAWIEVESAPGWNQGVGPATWFKIVYAGTLIKGPYDVAALLTLQALACLCAVLLLRRVWRLFGWGYLAFAAVVLLDPAPRHQGLHGHRALRARRVPGHRRRRVTSSPGSGTGGSASPCSASARRSCSSSPTSSADRYRSRDGRTPRTRPLQEALDLLPDVERGAVHPPRRRRRPHGLRRPRGGGSDPRLRAHRGRRRLDRRDPRARRRAGRRATRTSAVVHHERQPQARRLHQDAASRPRRATSSSTPTRTCRSR